MVEISYLKSYENMGQAAVTCESGCSCERTVVDGHGQEKFSQVWEAWEGGSLALEGLFYLASYGQAD